ncbi:hypothetical protein IT570_09510 [Candidatus Sumerlaeota bacterium]|nr:hypothetical protein [Candidatus Sumerlaeota bacterium]
MTSGNSKKDSGFRRHIKAEDVSASSWADAIRELEESGCDLEGKHTPPPRKTGNEPTQPRIDATSETSPELSRTPGSAMSRYDELRRAPTLKMQSADLGVIVAFSDLIAKVNVAGKAINDLKRAHPDFFPDRLFKTWTDNLKETSTVMMKELHEMRNGRQQKKYDKRCICKACHGVFMVSLGADQLCDACKAARVPKGGGAYARRVEPQDTTAPDEPKPDVDRSAETGESPTSG